MDLGAADLLIVLALFVGLAFLVVRALWRVGSKRDAK
jgi:hypothetical protein